MRFIARKVRFVCVLLTNILPRSFLTGVVFADDQHRGREILQVYQANARAIGR
jgi:hypothetical protein